MDKYHYLDEVEKSLVESFYKNEKMREAVKKVLLAGAYENGVLQPGKAHNGNMNWAYGLPWDSNGFPISDQALAMEVRTIAQSIKNIEIAFQKELPSIRVAEKPKEKKVNPGK